MELDLKNNRIVMSSGRTFYAYACVIGLITDDDAERNDRLTYGYDGYLGGLEVEQLDSADLVELADYMIERWQRFKDKALKQTSSQAQT